MNNNNMGLPPHHNSTPTSKILQQNMNDMQIDSKSLSTSILDETDDEIAKLLDVQPEQPHSFNNSLFHSYASQFGLNPTSSVSPTVKQEMDTNNNRNSSSVEEYAALMGVSLDNNEPASANMHYNGYFDNIKIPPGGMSTSSTLPAGFRVPANNVDPQQQQRNMIPGAPIVNNNATMLNATRPRGYSTGRPNGENIHTTSPANNSMVFSNPDMPTVGSHTLSPEMLSTMRNTNYNRTPMGTPNNNQTSLLGNSWNVGHSTWSGSDMKMIEKDMEAIAKADKSRERNRDHSRKSRLRKKIFVDNLKVEVEQLAIYKQICEQAFDLLAVLTTEDVAVFTFASAAYSRILGYDVVELTKKQKSFYDLVHPNDKNRVKEDFKRVCSYGELPKIEYQIQAIDGNYFQATTSARLSDRGIICSTRVEKENEQNMANS